MNAASYVLTALIYGFLLVYPITFAISRRDNLQPALRRTIDSRASVIYRYLLVSANQVLLVPLVSLLTGIYFSENR